MQNSPPFSNTFGSPMPTRQWSKLNSQYKFGFNGKEKDNEINVNGGAYHFGARIYDSRLGRWLSLDPLMGKYADFSSFCYSINSPITFYDPDGKEPIKPGVTSSTVMVLKLQAMVLRQEKTTIGGLTFVKYIGITTLDELREHFGSSGVGSDNGNGDPKRYLYSKKWGWIDMKHVAMAASQADNFFISGSKALSLGETVEYNQEHSIPPNSRPNSKASAWDYEDLVSNLIGVGFENYLETSVADGKDMLTNLSTYLKDLGFDDDPEVAGVDGIKPIDNLGNNYGEDKNIVNYTYDPMFAPDKDKRTNTTDKIVLEIQKNSEKTTGKDIKFYKENETHTD